MKSYKTLEPDEYMRYVIQGAGSLVRQYDEMVVMLDMIIDKLGRGKEEGVAGALAEIADLQCEVSILRERVSRELDINGALREAVEWLEEIMECEEEFNMLERWKKALAKADGE